MYDAQVKLILILASVAACFEVLSLTGPFVFREPRTRTILDSNTLISTSGELEGYLSPAAEIDNL